MIRKIVLGAVMASLFAVTGLSFGTQSASAEVVRNVHLAVSATRDNPCEEGTRQIALSGEFHVVWYTTPDGTLKMNIQGHFTGMDVDGTRYIFNTQQHMEHWNWPVMTPYTDTLRLNLVSKGSTANALVVMTFDVPAGGPQVPTTSATACVG